MDAQALELIKSAQLFQSLQPAAFLAKHIAASIRPDGRKFSAHRATSISSASLETANGSALVKIGNTTVICGITLETATPSLENPGHGWLVPNVELPALSSSKYKVGPPSEEAQVLAKVLQDVVIESNLLHPSSLCIEHGKAAWVINADLCCLNAEGNLFDACIFALTAALRSVKLPAATWNEDTSKVICSNSSTSKLELSGTLLPCSFGIFQDTLISDPSAFEELLLQSTVHIVRNAQNPNHLNFMRAQGGGLSPAVIGVCIRASLARAEELHKLLTESENLA